jgi:diguanylate cyclase (GGDEF)-like protein
MGGLGPDHAGLLRHCAYTVQRGLAARRKQLIDLTGLGHCVPAQLADQVPCSAFRYFLASSQYGNSRNPNSDDHWCVRTANDLGIPDWLMTNTSRRGEAEVHHSLDAEENMQPDHEPLSILLVEDEGITGQDIKECLSSLGYEVVGWASEGQEAVDLAASLNPALILMDVGLRGSMDGIEAARLIQQEAHVPIIFLTGFRDTDTLRRAVLTGPHGYLLKPFQDVELRSAIEVAVYKHRAENAIREREAALLRNAEMLESLSLVDDLTSLRNRRGFFTLAQQEIKLARREHRLLALFFMDLNGLKLINDRLGHASGDNALRDTAAMLRQTFRESDVVARLGGDEFVALANITDERAVEAIQQRLAQGFVAFNKSSGRGYELAVSVGAVVSHPANDEDVAALLERADERMYRQKRGNIAPDNAASSEH